MNTRERDISKQINDGQAENQGIEQKGIEHIDNTTKNPKDKFNEGKKKEKDIREAIKWSQWGKELRVGSLNCKDMLEKQKGNK